VGCGQRVGTAEDLDHIEALDALKELIQIVSLKSNGKGKAQLGHWVLETILLR